MKIIWFEDMKADLRKILQELNLFLDINLTPDQLDELKNHLSIDQMREAATSAAKDKESKEWMKKFFRKGTVGDWKHHLSEEKRKIWDEWIQDNLRGTSAESRFSQK